MPSTRFQGHLVSGEVLAERGVPELLRAGLVDYFEAGLPPGGFLSAVLENNLREAVQRSGDECIVALKPIMAFLVNDVPDHAWGSPGKVKDWVQRFAR